MTDSIPTPYTPETAYAVKVVVFLENGPQTDTFSQVQFTSDQMKELLATVVKVLKPIPNDTSGKPNGRQFPLNVQHTYKFPEIQTIYSEKEIGV